jgi:release factor glutamine methyltransferase
VVHRLRTAGCVFAEDEADVLLRAAPDARTLEDMVASRAHGLPLEQVVGWAEFAGVRIGVGLGVFVPRRRTEFLARLVVDAVPLGAALAGRAVVVDLCCGTGAIAAVVAAQRPGTELFAVDVHPAAVECATRNLDGLATVLLGDLDEPLPPGLRGTVDVIVANAPYVPSDELAWLPREAREHEPAVTLDGGPDGIELHRRIAELSPSWLRPGGRLLVETSASQAERTLDAFVVHGLAAEVCSSSGEDATVVVGTRPTA